MTRKMPATANMIREALVKHYRDVRAGRADADAKRRVRSALAIGVDPLLVSLQTKRFLMGRG